MDILISMKAEELDGAFIDFFKKSFKGKLIAVHVYEERIDEIEYLLSDPIHKEKILATIKEVENIPTLKPI